jgi:hypothetical protein
MRFILLIGSLAITLASCDEPSTPTADQHMQQVQTQTTAEADREVGFPAIVNWAEKRQVKDLYELRDKNVPTWTYMQGIDGRLICMGQSIGYGIPYAVQFSNPQMKVRAGLGQYSGDMLMTQAEPNGLYMPADAEGTWVQMLDPTTQKVVPVYVEPRVTVSPFKLTGPVVAKDCP